MISQLIHTYTTYSDEEIIALAASRISPPLGPTTVHNRLIPGHKPAPAKKQRARLQSHKTVDHSSLILDRDLLSPHDEVQWRTPTTKDKQSSSSASLRASYVHPPRVLPWEAHTNEITRTQTKCNDIFQELNQCLEVCRHLSFLRVTSILILNLNPLTIHPKRNVKRSHPTPDPPVYSKQPKPLVPSPVHVSSLP